MIVVAIAFLIPILLVKLRLRFLPVVVAEILVGLIIGKSGLNLITEDPWLELLSTLGLIYLMFLSGLEIDFGQFRFNRRRRKRGNGAVNGGKNGSRSGGLNGGASPNPLVAATLVFVILMAVSYGLGLGLMEMGFVSEPYLMMIIIATISLGVVVPVLKEQKLIETPYGQTILLVTVIADFVTMIIFAVYLSMISESVGSTTLILIFFLLIVLVYFGIRHFIKGKLMEGLVRGTSQIGTRGVFALILLFVVLSENMGVENILGAFLAGVIVSLLAPDSSFQHQLESFGYGFLIPIFFVMVGVKLNIWELMQDWKVVLFIPVLLIALFISKLIPSTVLRIWYGWKEAWGAGVLITSTLSLVIAAATVALDMGIIDSSMHGALILVAILSCFISPILFNRLVPKHEQKPPKVAIIGANHVTLPVSQDLKRNGYEVELFSSQTPGADANDASMHSGFQLTEVNKWNPDSLAEKGAFEADIIVCASMEEDVNLQIARQARNMGMERIIVRMEEPENMKRAEEEGFTVFSTLYSARTLLKSLIESPSAVLLITEHDDSIQEVVVNNPKYSHTMLRDLPFIGKVLVLRIYRGQSFIIPHGSTELLAGDRLLVSGNGEEIQEIRQELE